MPKSPGKSQPLAVGRGANSSLIFQLLCEVEILEKTENFKVLFGKKDKHEVVGYPLFLWAVLISLCAEYLRRIKDQRLQTDSVCSAARYVCYRTGYRDRQGQSENGKVRTVHLWLFSSDEYIFLASLMTTSSILSASTSLGALAPMMNHRSSHRITSLNVWISTYLLRVPSQTLQSLL